MMSQKQRMRNTSLFLCLLLFLLSAGLRAFLSFSGRGPALSYPDELASLSLSRSLAQSGSFSVWGVPAGFPGLLYALLLVPFRAIGNTDLRLGAIVVFNAVLLSSALFPAWRLCCRFLKNSRWRLPALLAFFLAPSLNLSLSFLPDNLYIPLFLWALLALLRFRDRRTPLRALVLGFLCALLCLTRALGFLFTLCAALWLLADLFRKEKPEKPVLSFLLFLGAAVLPVLLLQQLFCPGQFLLFLGRLVSSLPASSDALLYTLVITGFFLVCFVFTAGIFPVLCPLPNRDPETGKLFRFLLLFLVPAALLTVLTQTLQADYGNLAAPLLLRSVAPVAPLFFLLFLARLDQGNAEPSPVSRRRRAARSKPSFRHPCAAGLLLFAVLSLLVLLPSHSSVYDAPGLSALRLPLLLRLVPAVLAVAGLLVWRFGGRRLFPAFAAVVLLATELSGAVAFWPVARTQQAEKTVDPAQLQLLDEALASLDGRVLVIGESSDDPVLHAMDSRLSRSYSFVSMKDLNAAAADAPLDQPIVLDLAKDGVPAPVELRCLTGRSAYPWDKADYIVSLGGAYLPFSDTFEDLTPPGLTLASVWRQKDPSSLRLRHLVTASVNEVLSFTEGENNFRRFPVTGFSYTEENWTWSNGNESVISMVLGAKVQDYTYLVVTWSRAMTLGNQLCRVEVNGSVVFEGSLAGEGDQDLWIPTTVLGEEGILDLHFFFPTALHSDEGDPRLLAVAFTSLELSVEE